jgi:hypothetical protein
VEYLQVGGDVGDGLQGTEDVTVPEKPLQPLQALTDLGDQLGGGLDRQLQVRIRWWGFASFTVMNCV